MNKQANCRTENIIESCKKDGTTIARYHKFYDIMLALYDIIDWMEKEKENPEVKYIRNNVKKLNAGTLVSERVDVLWTRPEACNITATPENKSIDWTKPLVSNYDGLIYRQIKYLHNRKDPYKHLIVCEKKWGTFASR